MKIAVNAVALAAFTVGDFALAQQDVANPSIQNIKVQFDYALVRMEDVAKSTIENQESYMRDKILGINNNFVGEFHQKNNDILEKFTRDLHFLSSFSMEKVSEILEESYMSTNFAASERRYEDNLIDYISESIADIYQGGERQMRDILWEHLKMIPDELQNSVQQELDLRLSEYPNLPNSAPNTDQPEINLIPLKAAASAIVARRLALSGVGRRLLSGLGSRLGVNVLGRGATAVLLPGGEFCGPAIILCEAGLFVVITGWGLRNNKNDVITNVEEALNEQTATLRRAVRSNEYTDEIWEIIDTEVSSLLEEYLDAVEEIMRDVIENCVKQNVDYVPGDLTESIDGEGCRTEFKNMAATYGDRFVEEYRWLDRYNFMSAMGERARILLNFHGSKIIDLYLERPEILERVVRDGASVNLIGEILRAESVSNALIFVGETVRRTGQLQPAFDAVLVDILRFNLPIQPGEIDPLNIRIAAENAAQLRSLTMENSNTGATLYAQVLRGSFSMQVLDYILRSTNPARMASVFSSIPERTVSNLIRSVDVTELRDFIAAFSETEVTKILSLPQADTYLDIFSHRSGGPEGVRAWRELMNRYGRPPLPWMQEQFLWIADLGYEPISISFQMINTAYDSSEHPEFLRRFWVRWTHVSGWPWGSLLLFICIGVAFFIFAPRLVRGFTNRNRYSANRR